MLSLTARHMVRHKGALGTLDIEGAMREDTAFTAEREHFLKYEQAVLAAEQHTKDFITALQQAYESADELLSTLWRVFELEEERKSSEATTLHAAWTSSSDAWQELAAALYSDIAEPLRKEAVSFRRTGKRIQARIELLVETRHYKQKFDKLKGNEKVSAEKLERNELKLQEAESQLQEDTQKILTAFAAYDERRDLILTQLLPVLRDHNSHFFGQSFGLFSNPSAPQVEEDMGDRLRSRDRDSPRDPPRGKKDSRRKRSRSSHTVRHLMKHRTMPIFDEDAKAKAGAGGGAGAGAGAAAGAGGTDDGEGGNVASGEAGAGMGASQENTLMKQASGKFEDGVSNMRQLVQLADEMRERWAHLPVPMERLTGAFEILAQEQQSGRARSTEAATAPGPSVAIASVAHLKAAIASWQGVLDRNFHVFTFTVQKPLEDEIQSSDTVRKEEETHTELVLDYNHYQAKVASLSKSKDKGDKSADKLQRNQSKLDSAVDVLTKKATSLTISYQHYTDRHWKVVNTIVDDLQVFLLTLLEDLNKTVVPALAMLEAGEEYEHVTQSQGAAAPSLSLGMNTFFQALTPAQPTQNAAEASNSVSLPAPPESLSELAAPAPEPGAKSGNRTSSPSSEPTSPGQAGSSAKPQVQHDVASHVLDRINSSGSFNQGANPPAPAVSASRKWSIWNRSGSGGGSSGPKDGASQPSSKAASGAGDPDDEDVAAQVREMLRLSMTTEEEGLPPTVSRAPTGVVALLFTDIQGSTQMWECFGRKFKQVLDTHHRIMRAATKRHWGYEVKTEGDAFFVAFSRPTDAVRFALEVQLELLDAEWPEWLLNEDSNRENIGICFDDPDEKGVTALLFRGLRVRIGVYTGEPEVECDETTKRIDYYGQVVNRAARVEGLAEGGQILMCKTTHDRVIKHVKFSSVVESLGPRKLKGIDEPEHVYQILPKRLSRRRFKNLQGNADADEAAEEPEAEPASAVSQAGYFASAVQTVEAVEAVPVMAFPMFSSMGQPFAETADDRGASLTTLTVVPQEGRLGLRTSPSPAEDGMTGIFVSDLEPRGAAHVSSLNVGDMILSVNGTKTRDVTHEHFVQVLGLAAQSGEPIIMEIRRGSTSSGGSEPGHTTPSDLSVEIVSYADDGAEDEPPVYDRIRDSDGRLMVSQEQRMGLLRAVQEVDVLSLRAISSSSDFLESSNESQHHCLVEAMTLAVEIGAQEEAPELIAALLDCGAPRGGGNIRV